jgi:hypothetical protein
MTRSEAILRRAVTRVSELGPLKGIFVFLVIYCLSGIVYLAAIRQKTCFALDNGLSQVVRRNIVCMRAANPLRHNDLRASGANLTATGDRRNTIFPQRFSNVTSTFT